MPEESGGWTKYTSSERDVFAGGGDAYFLLSISDDMEIVLDPHGFICDAWDSKSKKTYGIHGNEIGVRDDSYSLPPDAKNPEDMSDDELEDVWESAKWDYSSEARSIRKQQAALKAKEQGLNKYSQERLRRDRAKAGKSAYLHRIHRIVVTGEAFGYRSTSRRSYQRTYRGSKYRFRAFSA